MNKRGCFWLLAIAKECLLLLRGVLGCFYAVHQTEQVIAAQFGPNRWVRRQQDPGLHFKLPVIQEVNRIDKRFFRWNGMAGRSRSQRGDKTYIQCRSPLRAGASTIPHPGLCG